MKLVISEDVFERVEEDSFSKAKDAISKGMYEEAESIGVLTLIRAGIMTQLNLMGMNIWNMLKEPLSVEELAEKIGKEYDISFEACFEDVNLFVKDLLEQGFLKYE